MKSNAVRGFFYMGAKPSRTGSLIAGILMFVAWMVPFYLSFYKGIIDTINIRPVNYSRIAAILLCMVWGMIWAIPTLKLLFNFVSISINDRGIQYRYFFTVARTIPWYKFKYIRIQELQTWKGCKIVVLCRLHYQRKTILYYWDGLNLRINANETFIEKLKKQNITVYDSREDAGKTKNGERIRKKLRKRIYRR